MLCGGCEAPGGHIHRARRPSTRNKHKQAFRTAGDWSEGGFRTTGASVERGEGSVTVARRLASAVWRPDAGPGGRWGRWRWWRDERRARKELVRAIVREREAATVVSVLISVILSVERAAAAQDSPAPTLLRAPRRPPWLLLFRRLTRAASRSRSAGAGRRRRAGTSGATPPRARRARSGGSVRARRGPRNSTTGRDTRAGGGAEERRSSRANPKPPTPSGGPRTTHDAGARNGS